LNQSRRTILSVDVPTGLGVRPMIRPALTVTFAEAKVGMTEENSGRMIEVDIGFPDEARDRCGPGEARLLPRPDPAAHKGYHGRVVIIGGGPYTGAPILAGLGAYRAGADLVYLLVPENVAGIARAYMPEFIVQALPGPYLQPAHVETIKRFCRHQRANAMVLGPGSGRETDTGLAVCELLGTEKTPVVLDADGLYFDTNASPLSTRAERFDGNGSDLTILTPHEKELEHLGCARRDAKLVLEAAKTFQTTILAKGPVDLVTDGKYIKENHTGNPRMAVGGTGDVLAGCVGALRARGLSGYQAARLGAYLVGRAGDLALEELGWGFLASEVANRIPRALELALKV